MPGLVVVITVALDFLEYLWGFPGLSVLLRGESRHLIYLVGMAFLLLGCGDIFSLRRHALGFLRPASEIIIQARSLINQNILVCRESLNNYGVLNIRTQPFIELSHFSPFVLIYSGRVLRKPR
jgi:hypothetical protein